MKAPLITEKRKPSEQIAWLVKTYRVVSAKELAEARKLAKEGVLPAGWTKERVE